MFNASKTRTTILATSSTAKFICNKLLLLFLILNISPLSHELEQKQQPTKPTTLGTVSSSDYLIVKRDFELIFENFTCSTNNHNNVKKNVKHSSIVGAGSGAVVEKLSCSLSKNAKRRYLQMEMSFKRQINQFDFNILIILQRPYHATEKQFVLFNLTNINGCDLLAAKNQVTLMYWARTALQHYSNLPRKCPMLAHTSYYTRGFKWDMEQMPSFFVEAPILIEFTYILENATKIFGSINAKLELKPNKKFMVS